jgi:hypothetical protein
VIERATVRLVAITGGEGRSLRWFSRDDKQGVSMQDLDVGRIYLVPVVRRDETDNRPAFITNENWMLEKVDKEKWPLHEGRHNFWLQVHAGQYQWRGEYMYRITVPPPGSSNGPFTMEIHYGNIY